MNELTITGIYLAAYTNGVRCILPLLANIALWALTVWIPYLNVGTTIGLVGLPAKMARGEPLSPVEIFDARYRRQMGEFFLVMVFMQMGTFVGILFGFIPGFVIGLAWMLAPLLVVDRSVNPSAAIQASNNLTYGKKWIIFFGVLLIHLTNMAAVSILVGIGMAIHAVVGAILLLACLICLTAVGLGAMAHIYGTLLAKVPARSNEPVEPLRATGT